MNKIYTGIGSRKAPEFILDIMYIVGMHLAQQGYILRSGHADGSDMRFEQGCDISEGSKEIYIPCNKFNNASDGFVFYDIRAEKLAMLVHPNWNRVSEFGRLLHTRNVAQLVGPDMDHFVYSDFVICWTKQGKPIGGTATAIKLAAWLDIPVINLGLYVTKEECINCINTFFKEIGIPIVREMKTIKL